MTAATILSASPGAEDIDLAADADCIAALSCGRSSFSYHRLPEPRLRLTIRKLDDSHFDVQIARTAAVWELKAAIEAVFMTLYFDTDVISWQHVWSHFCLCFKDEKLTDDKATLRAFGIKDCDELHFAQHLSVDYSPCKSSKNHSTEIHRRSRTSLDGCTMKPRTSLDNYIMRPRSLLDDLMEDGGEKKLAGTRHSTSALEEGFCVYQHDEAVEEGRKKGNFFRGWFSYSKLKGNTRTHSEDAVRPSSEKKGARPKLGKWLSSKKSKAPSK